ncbi:MAG: hypothetical protein RLZZ461_305 [Planctomycetota bacterium]
MASTPDESDCFDSTTLEALAGGMPPNDRQTSHLAGCAGCRDAIGALGSSIELLEVAVRSGHGLAIDPGTRVPGYRLIREIHRGGQGVVWLAEQDGTRRLVAIKMLLAGVAATSVQRRRFEREIEVVASLSDPAIVTIFEQGVTSDGVPYYAMEFVEGRRFDDWVSERRPTTRVAVNMVATIAAAVGTAHRRGIIHRDLKPGNILIDEAGLPKVLDFGLARLETERDFDATVAAVTEDGAFLGNFAYAAPEQLTGSPNAVDTSADVYALGLLLYEAIAGRPAFAAPESIAALLGQRVGRVPQRPSIFAPEVGHELDLIVLRALDPDPDRRYATAGEFADDLHRLLDGRPVLARGDSIAYILRKAALRHLSITIVAGTSLLLILTAVIALAVLYRESASRLARAESVSKVYESAFEFVDPQAEGSMDLRAPDLIMRLVETARTALVDQPLDQARMLLLAGDSYCNLELIDEAERCFEWSNELTSDLRGDEAQAMLATGRHGLGRVEYFRGLGAAARAESERRLGRNAEADASRRESVARFDAAIEHYESAVSMRRDDPLVPRGDHAWSLQHLAWARFSRLNAEDRAPKPEAVGEILDTLNLSRAIAETASPPNPERVAANWNMVAAIRERIGDGDGAIEAARRAADLVDRDEVSAWAGRAQASLGTRLLRAGRPGEAVDPLQRGVMICRAIYGDESTITTRYWTRLLRAEVEDGRFEEALQTIAELGDIPLESRERRSVSIDHVDALAGLSRTDDARSVAIGLRSAQGDDAMDRQLEHRLHLLGLDEAMAPAETERAELLARWRWNANGAID